MDEKALQVAHKLFVKDGYNGDISDFKTLISTNPKALDVSHKLFVKDGYNGDIPDFKTLLGIGEPESIATPEVKKKGRIMGLPSTGGSLDSEKPEDESWRRQLPPTISSGHENYGRTVEDEQVLDTPSKKLSAPPFDPFKGKLVRPTEKGGIDVAKAPSSEDESKKLFKVPQEKQAEIKQTEDIGKKLEQITPELMSQSAENAVPYLNYLFKDSGVSFEETGISGDYVTVTTPEGKRDFPLDIFFDSKKTKTAEELKDYIKTSTNYVKDPIIRVQKEVDKYNNQILNEKNYIGAITNINIEANDIEKNKYDYIKTSKNYDDLTRMYNSYPENQRNTPEVKSLYDEITKVYGTLKGQKEVLDKSIPLYIAHKKDLDYNVGKYVDMLEDKGTYGDMLLQGVAKSAGSISSGIVNTLTDVVLMSNPYLTDEVKKTIKKEIRSVTDPLLRDGWSNLLKSEDSSTEQYISSDKRSYAAQASYGLATSSLSMLGGAPIRAISMFSQVYDGMTKEIEDDPELSKIPENDKLALKVITGGIGSALENYGFRNAIESKGLLNNLALKVIGQYKPGAAIQAASSKELIDNVVKGEIQKGALKLVGGFLAEAETGVAQEIADISVKQVYNDMQDKQLFTTPETIGEYMSQVGKAGFLEGLGGFLITGVSTVGSAYKAGAFKDLSDNTLKVFGLTANNEKIQKAYVADLKLKVNLGELSLDEAKQELANYQKAGQLFNQIPPGLSLDQTKESLDLLKQKQDLTEKIKDKDPSLVKPYKEQIDAIDEKLTNITKNAIQEQTTSESMLRNEQPEMGLQGMGEGDTQLQETTTGTQKALTDEEQKRKVVLEEALQSPDTTTGTVTIGDIAVPIAEAQKELDALAQTTQQVKPLNETTDESKTKNQTKTDEAQVLEPIEFSKQIENEYGVIVDLTGNSDKGDLTLSRIEVPKDKRSTGVGSKAMEAIIKYADSIGRRIVLTPSIDFGGTSVNRLKEFYKKFGFVENKGKNKDFSTKDSMYREPQKPIQQEVGAVGSGISITNAEKINTLKAKGSELHSSIINTAQKAIKTLKSVLPNFDIVIHDTEESYNAAVEKVNGLKGTAGNFSYTKQSDGSFSGSIDINLNKANKLTVAHEVAHGIMLKVFGENEQIFKTFVDKMQPILNSTANKYLVDFANNYKGDVKYEEYIVELAAILEQEYTKISPTILQKIAAVINETVSKITGGKITVFEDTKNTKELIDFLNTVSKSIRQGEEIKLKYDNKGLVYKSGSKAQAEKIFSGEESRPVFNTLNEVADWLSAWSKKNKIIKKDLTTETDKSIVNAIIDHTKKELDAWEKVKDGYEGFYDEDIPLKLNPELVSWAKKKYNRELTTAEVSLYHILSSFASPSATPVFDSNIGLQIFDKYLRTGELSAYTDKQATVWETDKKGKRFDTGKPKLDDEGKPVMSQIARAYATESLNKFKSIVDYFKGDVKKAVEWIESKHSYEELSKVMGTPLKGPKSLQPHENLSREDGGFGVFATSGPKLGSYILNRVGEYGTVTKDLWYARTMARLFGEPLVDSKGEVLKNPWAITIEGNRRRKLADEAWSKVAEELNTKPAIIQQRVWDFEKRLWQMLGAESSAAGKASEGLKRGIEEVDKKSQSIPQPVSKSQKGLINLTENDVLKYNRVGIQDKRTAQAMNQIGLSGVKFTKEEVGKKISEEFNKLIKDINKYIINEDSPAITQAIKAEITTLEDEGASLSRIESAKSALDENSPMRANYIKEYARAQSETLSQWKDYLNQSDYSDAFKYIILDAVLTHNYDFKTGSYTKRSNKTIRNFTPFDAGTLASIYDSESKALLKDYVEVQANNVNNIVGANSMVSTKEGKWLKFDGGGNAQDLSNTANKLSQLVQNTYWCTKTNALSQLKGGDFYVYVTDDEKGEYVPRIAVRMKGDRVGEVRGNASSKQDLEPDMLPVADKFLKESIPNDSGKKWLDSIAYNNKVKDFTKNIEDKDMSMDDILEYFDIIKDAKKYSVDYGENGLVSKLTENIKVKVRYGNVAEDLRGKIALYSSGIESNTEILINDYDNSNTVVFPKNLKYIGGNAFFYGSIVKDLGNLQSIGGNANFGRSKVKDLGNLQSIGGDAFFERSEVESLGNLQSIGGDAFLNGSIVKDLGNLQSIGGKADFIGSIVKDLGNLQSIGGTADFEGSKVESLGNLQSIGGNAYFGRSKVESLGNLQSIGGYADFDRSIVKDLGNLQSISGNAYFGRSKVESLGNLQSIGGNADFEGSKVESLGNLQSIGGYAYSNSPTLNEQALDIKEKNSKEINQPVSKSQKGQDIKDLASKIRSKKLSGLGVHVDFGISKTIYNGALEIAAREVEKGSKLGNAINKAIQWIDSKINNAKWNKGLFAKHLNDKYKVTLNGKEVEVEVDNSKPTAELINGFYSPLERGINKSKLDKATGKEWLKRLIGETEGDELKWTGVADYLTENSDKVIYKNDLLDYFKTNRIEIVEVVKEEPTEDDIDTLMNDEVGEDMSRDDAIEYLRNDYVENSRTKFSQYQLEGEKENYKEVLVTMPKKKALISKEAFEKYRKSKFTDAEYADLSDKYKQGFYETWYDNNVVKNKTQDFKSSHFDEPNILVHLRMNTRIDSNGNKVLFLEEVQSDWGQIGKKEGFKDTSEQESIINKSKEKISEYNKSLKKLGLLPNSSTSEIAEFKQGKTKRTSEINKAIARLEKYKDTVRNNRDWDAANKEIEKYETEKITIRKEILSAFNGIEIENEKINIAERSIDNANASTPQAPFVMDTNAWAKLGLKVALKEAVKQGADKIAWTTGTQQFDRWGSEEIHWKKKIDKATAKIEQPNWHKKLSEKFGDNFSVDGVVGILNMKYDLGKSAEEISKLLNLPKKKGVDFILDNISLKEWLDISYDFNKAQEYKIQKPYSVADKNFKTKEEAQKYIDETNDFVISVNEQTEGAQAFVGNEEAMREKRLQENNISITTKEQLRQAIENNLSRQRNKAEIDKLTDRVWNRMQTEDSGTSLPRKEGMEGFYGVPSENKLGIVGNVAKSLFKQEPKTVEIEGKKQSDPNNIGIERVSGTDTWQLMDGNKNPIFDTYEEANDARKELKTNTTTQNSIDITPELKESVESGIPLFKGLNQPVSKSQKGDLSESNLPGYDAMIKKLDKIIDETSNKIDSTKQRVYTSALAYLQSSLVYENATDVQREALVRMLNKKLGVREKSAPSPGKLFDTIKDIKNITMTDTQLLKQRIRDMAKSSRDTKAAWLKISAEVIKSVRALKINGKISTSQLTAILNKFSKINMFNDDSINTFLDYMSNVFKDVDYQNKLTAANKIKKQIAKLAANKSKNADLRALAKKFLELDTSLVEDIDRYNSIATQLKESLAGTKATESFVDIIDINDAFNYINSALRVQNKILLDRKADELENTYGISANGLTYSEIVKLIKENKIVTPKDEQYARDQSQKLFNSYSERINEILETGTDPVTGEDVRFTASEERTIKNFMGMDLSLLDLKTVIEAVDALQNFIQNKSIAKIGSVFYEYTGLKNSLELEKNKLISSKIKLYFSGIIGGAAYEQLSSLPSLIEKMFKGVIKGGIFEDKSGISSVVNGKAEATSEVKKYAVEYTKEFGDKKPNRKDFFDEENIVERGMYAHMLRTIIGTNEQMEDDFIRSKNDIIDSIEYLTNDKSSEEENRLGELYKKVYNKILKDAESIEDIEGKVSSINGEAVLFWVNKWDSKFDEMNDVSKSIYNEILEREYNYTPARYLNTELKKELDIEQTQSVFNTNNFRPGTLYKEESGSLKKAQHKPLPKGSYINLSFDTNNVNSMYDALIDIKTAGPIRQLQAFMENMSNIIPNKNDRNLLKSRVNHYVKLTRNKNNINNEQLSRAINKLNSITSIGVASALTSLSQPFKQVVPLAFNTIINANGLDIRNIWNKQIRDFIDNSGTTVANRSMASEAQITKSNKLEDLINNSSGIKQLEYIKKLGEFQLKWLLEKPDVFIARASWFTYYKDYLSKNKIKFDFNVYNEDAKNYATRMVNRQQNISDPDLGGMLFTKNDAYRTIVVKTIFAFANFRINQSIRLINDVTTLTSFTSSKQDKAIAAKSLAGFAVEAAAFRLVSIGTTALLDSITNSIWGGDDDEEEKQKRLNNIYKGQITNLAADMLSPVPLTDPAVTFGINYIANMLQMDKPEKERLLLFEAKPKDFVKQAGILGIAAEDAMGLYKLSKMIYTKQFVDDYGNTKTLSDEDVNKLPLLLLLNSVSMLKLVPTDVKTISKRELAIIKKQGKTEKQLTKKTSSKSSSIEDIDKEIYKEIENIDKEIDDAINENF